MCPAPGPYTPELLFAWDSFPLRLERTPDQRELGPDGFQLEDPPKRPVQEQVVQLWNFVAHTCLACRLLRLCDFRRINKGRLDKTQGYNIE